MWFNLGSLVVGDSDTFRCIIYIYYIFILKYRDHVCRCVEREREREIIYIYTQCVCVYIYICVCECVCVCPFASHQSWGEKGNEICDDLCIPWATPPFSARAGGPPVPELQVVLSGGEKWLRLEGSFAARIPGFMVLI